ncbi:MAG: hypothetical protein KAI17_16155 [Thiotrichaceae bacterium]|nr:hypothetical protein [Thiotrichaceae bacterium]
MSTNNASGVAQGTTGTDFYALLSVLFSRLLTLLFSLFVVFALYVGWKLRHEQIITAESGIGYALGITGGVLMLLLLIYPLRKRIRALSNFGSVKMWFGTHMLFGVIGPVLILYHSSFKLGSLNSSVALICMLLVAGSGLIGRYLYKRIHKGLYGVQKRLSEFEQSVENTETKLIGEVHLNVDLHARLISYKKTAIKQSSGLLSSTIHFFRAQIYTRLYFQKENEFLQAEIEEQGQVNDWDVTKTRKIKKSARKLLGQYFLAQRQASIFNVSERLFALWHVLHLPLFFMMIISGIIHVFAVHMY